MGCQNALDEPRKTLHEKEKSIEERREWDISNGGMTQVRVRVEEYETTEDGGLNPHSVLIRQRFVVLCSLFVISTASKVVTLESGSASGGVWKFWLGRSG